VLQSFRDEHNFIAGGLALNQQWPRLSDDMDIFQDQRHRLPDCVEPELQALRDAGFSVNVTTRDGWMVEAIVQEYGFETRVQCLDEPETSWRFSPAVADDELGFRLHQADVAVNKVLCASRRREVRDAVDIVAIARRYAPLGPLIWAAVAKDNTTNPTRLVQSIRARAFEFSDQEIRTVRMEAGNAMTHRELRETIGQALDDAQEYCEELAPTKYSNRLFIDSDERPVSADASALKNGLATAMPLRNFTPIPIVDENQSAADDDDGL
jgi:hypothetical protein